MEKELFELVESLDDKNISGFGIHPSSFVDDRFPGDEQGFRIYHKDGYCFDITREKEYNIDGDEIGSFHYEYHEGHFDGFKELTLKKAIELIKSEGVFV